MNQKKILTSDEMKTIAGGAGIAPGTPPPPPPDGFSTTKLT